MKKTVPDPAAMAQKFIEIYQQSQPVFQEALKRYSEDIGQKPFDPMNIAPTYAAFMEQYWKNPQKAMEAQAKLWSQWISLWQETSLKLLGKDGKTIIEPEKGDKRFKAPEWQESAIFDFLKQSYLLTSKWMEDSVRDAQDLPPEQKEKLAFYTRLFADALSPSNFAMTNPEVIKETLETGGENLVKGLQNLTRDLERGHGELKISMTDYEAFELGRNIATTDGAVVYQNDLMQLIQYTPTTKDVFKTPLLIVPPWINKYYILDLREDNSLIKWAVDQGHTVFTISWANPTAELSRKRFENYMGEGILDALSQIEILTGESTVNAIGYCLGGTLLAITLAYLAETGRSERIKSATFLTALLDFEHAGELKLFMDDTQLELMDRTMAEKGVFNGRELQKTFSMLRANDLIWSFVVNNYLMGREPFPFDLLYWNDDCTNLPAAMHSFYLRKMYRDNMLTKAGGVSMNGVPIDLSKIKTPTYFLSTKDDHIAPWKATFEGTRLLGGDVTFTLAASGHIAGVVNSPVKNKYCYWTAQKDNTTADEWLNETAETTGSWWPHWQKWVGAYTGESVPPRKIHYSIEPAPGSYVKVGCES